MHQVCLVAPVERAATTGKPLDNDQDRVKHWNAEYKHRARDLGALRREIGNIHAQRLARDGLGGIFGEEMHVGDDGVFRQHEIVAIGRGDADAAPALVDAVIEAGMPAGDVIPEVLTPAMLATATVARAKSWSRWSMTRKRR